MTATFIGHGKIANGNVLRRRVEATMLRLIENGVDTFLFGSVGEFNDLCVSVAAEIKSKGAKVSMVYVRAEYPYVDARYIESALGCFDSTYMPEKLVRAGKAVYAERNGYMIDRADVCVFYYGGSAETSEGSGSNHGNGRSGTETAYLYAKRKNKKTVNLFDDA